MKNRKKRIDPLIPALSAVAVILAVILAVLLFTEPKSGEGSGETVSPVQESSHLRICFRVRILRGR